MASTISTSTSGTTYLSGTASGLNTDALIANAVNAKLRPKVRLTDQVTTNTNKIASYQNLQTKAQTLKTTVDSLKSDILGNVFNSKTASYTSSTSTTAASVLTASVTSAALAGSHDVVVTQNALPFVASGTDHGAATAALGLNGSFTLAAAGKTAATFTVTSSTTLQDLRNAINAKTSTTGVKADLLQSASGQYRLIIKSADTGVAVTAGGITGDNVLNSLGLTNTAGSFTNITQPPRSAIISVDGTSITSTSNNFSNVLTGLSIDVLNSAPGTTITVKIATNSDAVKTKIQEFVTNYNDLKATIAANQKVNADGSVDASAYLFNEYQNYSLGQNLSKAISGSYGSSSLYNSLRSIGITIDASNNLVIDDSTLSNALTSNLSDVESLFASSGSATGLGDALSTLLNSYANTASGSIAKVITSLQSTNVTLTTQAKELQTSADAYQQTLIEKYAKMETIIKKGDTLKKQIAAILTGSTKVSG